MKNTEILLYKKLFLLFLPYKKEIIFVFFSLFFTTAIYLIIPILSKNLLDNGILKGNFKYVVCLVSLLFIIELINSIVDIVKEFMRTSISAKMKNFLYQKAFSTILASNKKEFESSNSAELLSNMQIDIGNISSICEENMFFIVTQLLMFIGGFIGLLIIDVRLTIIVVIFIPIKYFIMLFFSQKRQIISESYIKSSAKFSHWMGDTIEGIKDIQHYGIEKEKSRELKSNIFAVIADQKKITLLDSFNQSSDILLMNFLEGILYIVGAIFLLKDSLSVGGLFAFITYSTQVMNPIATIINLKYIMAGILPSAKRFFDFIAKTNEFSLKSTDNNLSKLNSLEFKNVDFEYNGRKIFQSINFSVNKKEKIAIVGNNGVGKSTLLNLILKNVEPTAGEILVNGISLINYNISSYRKNFSVLNQTNHVFDVSLYDNISMYEQFSSEKMNDIIKLCKLDEVQRQHRNHSLGINGQKISGGQRQKLLIARMIIRDRACYILDEATNNLDIDSQNIIDNFINYELKDKIVFVVIHNLKLLNKMDKVFYLDASGKLVIYNNPQEFLNLHSKIS